MVQILDGIECTPFSLKFYAPSKRPLSILETSMSRDIFQENDQKYSSFYATGKLNVQTLTAKIQILALWKLETSNINL